MSSAIDSAICAVTSEVRNRAADARARRLPGLGLDADTRSGFVLCSAGNRPKMNPVAIDSAAAKSDDASLQLELQRLAASGGSSDAISASVHRATTRPAMPPSTASTHDSVSSCTSRWRRLAPSDSRMAISVARPAPRASSRLAMFAQAMSSTMPGDGHQEEQRRLGFAMDRALSAVAGLDLDRLSP